MNSDSDGDFGFAFNNVHFSDRLLRIEITRGGQVSCSSIVDWVPYRTRRREDGIQFSAKVLAFATCQVESDLNKYSCERKYEKNKNKHEEATVTTKQETESGGEDENESHYCGMSTNPSLIRVIELHISSPILAAKSPFFYKMGMESSSYSDFGFAFNNVTFSDRLLRIEITHGGSEFSCSSIVHRKRKRDDVQNQTHVLDLADTCQVESDLNNNERHVKDENECRYWSTMTTNPSVLRVKELHISSPILAAKSPFFYKLFSNGMLESGQKHLTLRIEESEEAAVMELLHFMYRNSLSVTETPALLNVLMAADKFEVASCLKYCSCLLLNMPMTLDSALLLLDLPSTVLMADPVKLLINAAKQFLTSRYKNITKFNLEEVTALPLVGIKAILASNDLKLRSEDIVYDVVLSWAKKHYSVVEERQEILRSHLARYIRFPHMTCRRLRRISASDDFKPSVASKLVLEALFFKAESLHNRRVLAAEKYASLDNWFVERAYKFKPIKIMEFEVPRRQCIVYLDLTRKECDAIYPSSKIYSQVFHFEGQGFVLSAYCSKGPQNLFHCFGLFLGMHEKGSVSLTVDYEFSARSKPTEDFDVKYKGSNKFQAGKCVRYWNFFATPWDSFIAKDSPFFINDILHLRAELSIRL